MKADDELARIAQVSDRLAKRFPDTPLQVVRDIVDEERSRLTSNPIRDYVPILVEHSSRDRLRAEGHRELHHQPENSPDPRPGETIRAGEVPIETIFNARITVLNGVLGGGTS